MSVVTVSPGYANLGVDRVGGSFGDVPLMKMTAGPEGSAAVFRHVVAYTQNFTGNGNGDITNVSLQGAKYFAVQTKGTGAAPSAWTVTLEVSLDGTNFTATELVHASSALSDGKMTWMQAAIPCLYYRAVMSGISLGSATNIAVTTLSMP